FSTTTTTAQNEVNPAPLDVNLSNYETVFSYKWLYETLDKSRIEKSTTSNYKTSSIRKTMTSSPDKDLSSFSDISLHSSLLPISSTAAGCTRSLSAVEAIAAKYLALKQATIAKIIKHLIRRPYGVSVTNIGILAENIMKK
ncbi:unnamed protein product, partial [Rotaria sp. Silwood2]